VFRRRPEQHDTAAQMAGRDRVDLDVRTIEARDTDELPVSLPAQVAGKGPAEQIVDRQDQGRIFQGHDDPRARK
jgi:hypothetical protein